MNMTAGEWEGYRRLDFEVEGRESYIVCPHTAAAGNPWVWRTEFFGAFDTVDRELLARGWHVAYHRMSELYGNDTAMGYMQAFHKVATGECGLSARPSLFGFSRGGSYAVNYAHFHPKHTGSLYLDAPLTNFNGTNREIYDELFARILECYGVTSEEMKQFSHMPNDYAESVAKAGIPVLLCAGLADEDVYYSQNAAVFAARYAAAGGNLLLLTKPACGHHPHSFSDEGHVRLMADFLEQQTLR